MSIAPYLSSTNSGEFSPRMEGRVDFERYANAAKMCRNMVLFPQGGSTRRPGTRYVAGVKTSSLATKLIPFQFSEDDSYIIEAGNAYFRFYRRQAQLSVADTDAAVTNGTFTSDISSWTDISTGGASIQWDTGRMRLNPAEGGVAWARQSITISSANQAKIHVLRFTVDLLGGGGEVGFHVGSSSGAEDILAETRLGEGYHSIEFTPNATTFHIHFKNHRNAPIRYIYIDDVSFLDNQAMELTSPYATADLTNLRYFQAADVVYLLHPDYAPRRLERRGHRSWSIVETFFEDGPYLSIHDGDDLTPLQLASNSLFDNGIQGWTDNSAGNGFVAYNEAGKFAELDPGTSAGGGNAQMRTTVTVVNAKKHVIHVLILAAGPVTVNFGTTAGGSEYSTNSQNPGWFSYELTTTATTLHIQFSHNGYTKGRAGVGGCLIYSQDARLLEPTGTTGYINIDARGFTPFASTDVGRLLRLEWPGNEVGYGVITVFTSTSQVQMLVLRTLPSTTPTESWRFGAWGGTQKYPRVISFFDGRLAIANTEGKPNTIWMSQSGDLQNMRPDSFKNGASTVESDDAIAVTLSSTQINPIFWMSGQRQLMVGTAGGQWVVGSSQAAVTPTDISSKQHAAVPCANMAAVEINQLVLFAERSHGAIHDLGFSLEEDSFLATDLTILADHIFRSPVQEMVYQRAPYSIMWCRRNDGRLASLSYNKKHQVLGWSQTILGGAFGTGDAVVESIAAIPGASDSSQTHNSDERTELWMIVKRTVNGSTVRYIEFMEYFFDGVLREDYTSEGAWQSAMRTAQVDAFYVDCGLTYSGAATTSVSGLSHLEGQTVKVLADGKVLPDKTVSGGSISFNDAATKVQVGLAYTHRYESLKIAPPLAAGTSVNKVKIITGVGMVLLDTATFKVTTADYDENGRRQHDLYTIKFLRDHMDSDLAVPLFSGEVLPATEGAWSPDTRLYIEGDAPLPFTMLGLAPQMEIRER